MANSSPIPERSDSQRSYIGGDDELSVRRIDQHGKDVEGRTSDVGTFRSEISLLSSGGSRDLSQSCALKHFSKHKSSHVRFLAWVAYTRRYSNYTITYEERRTCPLLWCREVFDDQDQMLQHVWECPFLSKGLYFCYTCQKSERMGKIHKRCTGAPSRAERLTNVAKKIFSKLGATSHRLGKHNSHTGSSFNLTSSWKSTDVKDPELFRASPTWDSPVQAQEMPDTSIPIEMAADWTAACQELADTSIMDMVANDLHMDLDNVLDSLPQQDNYYGDILESIPKSPPKPRASTPKLSLDTSMSPLHRNQWKYPVAAYPRICQQPQPSLNVQTIDELVSPLSAVGPHQPFASLEVSPTETVASGASFFTDSGCTSATSGGGSSQCPSRVPSTKRTWDIGAIPEEHYSVDQASDSNSQAQQIPNFEELLTESLFSTPSVSRSSSNASGKGKAKCQSPPLDDTPSLVQSFSEVLDEHISHTKARLQAIEPDSATAELLALSKSTIVSTGLEVLAGVLEGRTPTSMVGVFAFTHIAYGCAIVTKSDEEYVHTDEWFKDLAWWISGISSDRQRQIYSLIASSIWQPNASDPRQSTSTSSTSSETRPLMKACCDFLDLLEYSENKASAHNSAPSAFNFEQMSFEFNAKSLVVDKLAKLPTIEAFWDDVQGVTAKLQNPGKIKSSRELELELLCHSKATSESGAIHKRFVDKVVALCDQLSTKTSGTAIPRKAHHIQDISILKRYLPEDIALDELNLHDLDSFLDDQFFDFSDAAAATSTESPDESCHSNNSNNAFSFDSSLLTPEDYLFTYYLQHAQDSHASITIRACEPPPIFHFSSPTPPATTTASTDTTHSIMTDVHRGSSSGTSFPTVSNAPRSNSQPTRTKTVDRYKCHCGFSPQGEEKWKASNLKRHKRTQHPPENGRKQWKCQWPGCNSVFTRSDNLRSHQKAQRHADLGSGGMEMLDAHYHPNSGGRRRRQRVESGEGGNSQS